MLNHKMGVVNSHVRDQNERLITENISLVNTIDFPSLLARRRVVGKGDKIRYSIVFHVKDNGEIESVDTHSHQKLDKNVYLYLERDRYDDNYIQFILDDSQKEHMSNQAWDIISSVVDHLNGDPKRKLKK